MKKGLSTLIIALFLITATTVCAQKKYYGQWVVKRYVLTTYAADGKTAVKGPLTLTPANYRIQIDSNKYSSYINNGEITYNLTHTGDKLLLKRKDKNGNHKVTIANIIINKNTLSFKSTSKSSKNTEISVAEMYCDRKQ